MKKFQRIALAAAATTATAAAVGVAGATANATTASPVHETHAAAGFLTPNMQWSGGTVGTIAGRANVAGLFAGVVAAFPDAHATIEDIFGQGDQVVVRVVVSGTQEGAVIGIPASGRHVSWDGVDVYRLSHGKISNIWAGDDWSAILYDTGTYKAPWIR